MEIRIFGLADDSIVDGPGVRYTVFVQGCPHHCPGCHNPASHDFSGGTLLDTDGIIRKISENPLLDGVTLSGGEPMCQPEACRIIADAAHARHMNVWCYTGYTLENLLKENDPARMALLHSIDVLVDGRFVLEKKSLALLYCGSSNQRLIDVPKTLQTGEIARWTPPAW